MTGLRSVALTLQLIILLVDFCLPLVSHQWVAARPWHTPMVVAVQRPPGHLSEEASAAVLDPRGWGGTLRLWLVSGTDLWSDLLLIGAHLILLLLSGDSLLRYLPVGQSVWSLPQKYTPPDLPPPDFPPRLLWERG